MSGFIKSVVAVTLLAFSGCALYTDLFAPPLKPSSMKRLEYFNSPLPDDMTVESLQLAAAESIGYLKKLNQGSVLLFADRKVSPAELIESHRRLVAIFNEEGDPERRSKIIRREFDIFKGTGKTDGGNALITGYYQPLLKGRKERDEIYRWPIYSPPADLVRVDLGLFSGKLKGKSIAGRVKDGKLIPYYDRGSIDRGLKLSGIWLEIAWVSDPIDLFFLHVQGSGVVEFEKGDRVFVNYAATNGREYRSIGKLLIGETEIPEEEMSLQAIRKWLKEHPGQLERVLFHNPSYIFFRAMDDGPFGSTGAKLVPGRSAAFDPAHFPKGALAHFTAELPVVENGEITGWSRAGRFVFNHDQGGAIKGAGRMDLFFGLGSEAEAAAGVLKHPGELLFFVLKKEVYAKLSGAR